ncbi:unnamed protein product [Acanthoscelides obtectus]|uniref:Uncharacterized protein n=1 Tax=Acanthoscelides obtectus TaxID=200917 RepID=A0A9P0KC85_ACAOB|nr:unnamed protein product [Acanthoscelides obtectus]CAK1671980.1 hypothetical protein AOBTE_LOCUS28587 [Acanthoscelides obtectus]
MFKLTLQGHTSRSHFKVTHQCRSETQGHTSRSLENSRPSFKVAFQGWHRRSALKVVWHRRSALKGVPEHTNPIYSASSTKKF